MGQGYKYHIVFTLFQDRMWQPKMVGTLLSNQKNSIVVDEKLELRSLIEKNTQGDTNLLCLLALKWLVHCTNCLNAYNVTRCL